MKSPTWRAWGRSSGRVSWSDTERPQLPKAQSEAAPVQGLSAMIHTILGVYTQWPVPKCRAQLLGRESWQGACENDGTLPAGPRDAGDPAPLFP